MLLAAGLLFAAPVQAAEGPATALDLVWQGVNLGLLLALLTFFLRKPVAAFFRASAGRQKEEYDSTLQEVERLRAAFEVQRGRLEGLEGELKTMVANAERDAQAERALLLKTARAEAERIRERARFELEQQFVQARAHLRAQLADETVKLAEALIRSRLDGSRHEQFVSTYIERIGAVR